MQNRKRLIILLLLASLLIFFVLKGMNVAFASGVYTTDIRIDHATAVTLRRMLPDYFGAGGYEGVGSYLSSYYGYSSSMLFENVTVPNSAEILTACITFTARNNYNNNVTRSYMKFENNDTAVEIPNKYDWDSRNVSAVGSLTWDGIPPIYVNQAYNSTELKTGIKLILDRPGWVSGNNMTIFIEDTEIRSDSTAYREFFGYDANATKCPVLHVQYRLVGYLRVFYNSGGGVEVAGNLIANGSFNVVLEPYLVNVSALVEGNGTFTFLNFTVAGVEYIANPQEFNVSGNATLWGYFAVAGTGVEDLTSPGDLALLIVLGLICVPLGIILLAVVFRRRH